MDGTLLRGSACLELSGHAGHRDAVDEMEARWKQGLFGGADFYEALLPLWRDLGEAEFERAFVGCEWIPGIEGVWEDIAVRGESSAVVTMSPQFFAARLHRWGVHTVQGAEVCHDKAVDPHGVLTPEHKVDIVLSLLRNHLLRPQDCVVYGDSTADLPLFKAVPNSVAVNATEDLKSVASVVYDGWDLADAYAAGRELLGMR
jgi:phosphoserine phosphatase